MHAVDGLGGDVHGGVEAEAESVPPRSLSMVLGTPTTLMPCSCSLVRDAQGVVAADGDQGLDPMLGEILHAVLIPSACLPGLVREVRRMVPPRGRMPATM